MDTKKYTLHEAIRCKNIAAVRNLISQGVDVNEVESFSEGITPLHLAAGRGNSDLVRLLIDAGANVDAKAGFGMTPLHEAVIARNIPVIKLLVDAGADVSVKNKFGKTLLQYAHDERNLDVAKILIDAEVSRKKAQDEVREESTVNESVTKIFDWHKKRQVPDKISSSVYDFSKMTHDAGRENEKKGAEKLSIKEEMEKRQYDLIVGMLREIKNEIAEVRGAVYGKTLKMN